MCTVTVVSPRLAAVSATAEAVPASDVLLRLACNRDELRTRPAARPPEVRRFGPRWGLMPVDPVSDGTWVAVNDAGLVATLLNTYPGAETPLGPPGRGGSAKILIAPPDNAALRSRGEIIPSLMHADGLDDAARAVERLDLGRYPPFRLVLAVPRAVRHFYSDGRRISADPSARVDRPLMFTSSGLGDEVVEVPRRTAFESVFAGPGDDAARQDAFHRHRFPDRPDLSVCMSRDRAATVSHTVVEVRADAVLLIYFDGPPGAAVCGVRAELPRG